MKNNNLSNERIKYLSKIKKDKIMVILGQIILLVGFLSVWEILARKNLIDSFITSQPSRIFKTFVSLGNHDLLYHIYVNISILNTYCTL